MSGLNSIGHQQLTVSTAAVGLTVPSGTRPTHCVIYVQNNPVRRRDDGTDPTAAIGIPMVADSLLEMMDQDIDYFGIIKSMEFIRSGAADAVLDIEYYTGGL